MSVDNTLESENGGTDETVDSGSSSGSSQGVTSNEQLPLDGCVRWMVLCEKTIAGLLLVLIVTTMASQVFARYVDGDPFKWSEEVARLALIWMTFLSAAFVLAEGRHIAVDMISTRVGDRGKLIVECLGYIVVAGSCLMLMIGGARFVWYVGKVGSPALEIPKTYWYGAGMVGLLLMAVHALINLIQVWLTGKPIPREAHIEEEAFQLGLEPGE